MKFRKKPVVIDAMEFETSGDIRDCALAIQRWAAECRPVGDVGIRTTQSGYVGLTITTLEGTMLAEQGDWIIRGVKGEFYPCKPDIFEATYEQVAPIQYDTATTRT